MIPSKYDSIQMLYDEVLNILSERNSKWMNMRRDKIVPLADEVKNLEDEYRNAVYIHGFSTVANSLNEVLKIRKSELFALEEYLLREVYDKYQYFEDVSYAVFDGFKQSMGDITYHCAINTNEIFDFLSSYGLHHHGMYDHTNGTYNTLYHIISDFEYRHVIMLTEYVKYRTPITETDTHKFILTKKKYNNVLEYNITTSRWSIRNKDSEVLNCESPDLNDVYNYMKGVYECFM